MGLGDIVIETIRAKGLAIAFELTLSTFLSAIAAAFAPHGHAIDERHIFRRCSFALRTTPPLNIGLILTLSPTVALIHPRLGLVPMGHSRRPRIARPETP